jgi:ribonuclease HI
MRQTFILDASYDSETGITGIGIVIHETDKPQKNRNGKVIDEISESYVGIDAGKGEMLAIFRAFEIASERGYKNIRTRSDYNYLRKSLKKSYEGGEGNNRTDLHGEIIRISNTFEKVEFGYKPRRKNQMAHTLARHAVKQITPIFRKDLSEKTNERSSGNLVNNTASNQDRQRNSYY